MRLMVNDLPGPVPIHLWAAFGWHVYVIMLDVILFPLNEAMWIVPAVVCLCLCVHGLKMMEDNVFETEKKTQDSIRKRLNSAKKPQWTHLWPMGAVTSEINYESNILHRTDALWRMMLVSKCCLIPREVGRNKTIMVTAAHSDLLLQYHNDTYMACGFKRLAGEGVAWVLLQIRVLI